MIAFDPSYDESSLDPDTERMTRVAAGDLQAFDELVRRNFASTVRIISAMMGSPTQSEDLAQDVFLRIFRSRQRYVPTAKFSTFLGTVTRNVVLNAKRSLARNRVGTTQFVDDRSRCSADASATAVPIVQQDLAGELDGRRTAMKVRQAIGQLPPRQRRAIELVYFHGMTYAGAAEEMQTSWKAVKSLLGRGRGALGKSLRKEYHQQPL